MQSLPITITSYADFERTFGGLWKESTLGFAVRDFFLNGGQRGIVVRVASNVLDPIDMVSGMFDPATTAAAAQAVVKAVADSVADSQLEAGTNRS